VSAKAAIADADVAIVDSGGANLASLEHALARIGGRGLVTVDAAMIAAAPRIIVPGVGSAQSAMRRLRETGLDTLLPGLRQPVLGICLGMQLLFRHSAEGDTDCLGIIDDRVRRLEPAPGLPVPHMGWNSLTDRQLDPLLDGIGDDSWFYFVHSYAIRPGPTTLASTDYGVPVAAVVRRDNFWGTQFHPERSSIAGARLLENFLRLC
jgi:glutamine amidotransferase